MRDGEKYKSVLTGLKAGMLFIGSIIGAGFASGKEILTFFAGNTFSLVFAVILAGIFFYLTGLLFFNLGKRIKADSLFKITEVLLKKYSLIFNVFLAFCYFILIAAMLAGIDALGEESLGYRGIIPIFSIIMLLLAILATRKGIKGLLKVNSLLVPAVILFIFAVCVFTLSKTVYTDSGNWAEDRMTFFTSIISSVLYVAMNMLLSSAVLISAGKEMNSLQIKTASFTAATVITVLLALVLLAFRLNYSQIQGMEMPMMVLASKISPIFGVFSAIVMALAIFTTLISSLYPLKKYLSLFIEKEKNLFIIVGIVCFLLSRIGFTYIISYIYPLMGVIGVVFIAFCALYGIQKPRFKTLILKNGSNIKRT